MKKITKFAFFALVFCLLCCVPSLAADNEDHAAMDKAVSYGLVDGGKENGSAPLTWGGALDILSRAFIRGDYNYTVSTGVAPETAAYRVAAEQEVLVPSDTTLPVSEATLNTQITAAQLGTLLNSYGKLMDGSYYGSTGSDPLTRDSGVTVIMSALSAFESGQYGQEIGVHITAVDQHGKSIAESIHVKARVGQYLSSLFTSVQSEQGKKIGRYKCLDFYGTQVSCFCYDYELTFRPFTERENQEQDFWDAVERGEKTAEDYYTQPFWLLERGDNSAKRNLLYGNTSQRRYANQSEAASHMVNVSFPCWRLNSDGTKRSATASISIHTKIADEVKQIMTEIYNDPEKFPIADMGGYGWRGDSAKGEHNCGTAIDINPTQNYQIRDGRIECGSFWKPGEDARSLKADGSVVRIFHEHGWTWGGADWAGHSDASQGYHDYMHFSYMGG